jgi:DNA-binding NarL/FixJ family response regulator
VLIVEDEPCFRNVLSSAVLATEDLALAASATDLAEGLRLLVRYKPDVLLVDIGLPDGSGIDLIRYAAKHLPNCESMVVTVFADDEVVIQCIEAGATGYLLKDSSDLDIVRQIRLLLDGGSPISPAIARRLLHRVGRHGNDPAGGASAASAPPASAITLSEQEHAVLSLCSRGFSYREIAELMDVTTCTVETYVKRIYRKLQVHSKTEALFEARKLGLVRD